MSFMLLTRVSVPKGKTTMHLIRMKSCIRVRCPVCADSIGAVNASLVAQQKRLPLPRRSLIYTKLFAS
jgi:hypothetical protein